MGWFDPASDLSDRAKRVLTELANSGSSEDAGVADTLNTIAGNGEEQADDAYLLGCAEQMLAAARSVIQALRKPGVRMTDEDGNDKICCPNCNTVQPLNYIEDISCEREQLQTTPEVVTFTAHYETDGWDDRGDDVYLHCGVCCDKFAIPDGLSLDFGEPTWTEESS